jgi:carbonic anhydrase/acetyltransferase-like protein (isoleucine patch superfamily)
MPNVKTIAELVAEDAELHAATAARLMASGVTIYRPDTCVIDAEVQVAPDTVIEPFVQLLGKTSIGSKCLIRSYTVIENCTLGSNVLVRQNCVLSESSVGDGAKIGPFAHLRPESEIGEDAHIGNFVETKKAKVGKGAKVPTSALASSPATTTGCTNTEPTSARLHLWAVIQPLSLPSTSATERTSAQALALPKTCPPALSPSAGAGKPTSKVGSRPREPAARRRFSAN